MRFKQIKLWSIDKDAIENDDKIQTQAQDLKKQLKHDFSNSVLKIEVYLTDSYKTQNNT